ncbi:MAG: CIA30 family protein [Pseudomonadota bacterium]
MPDSVTVIGFSTADLSTWRPINDGVMGGLSGSQIIATGNGTALFTGTVSLERNGGFASIRTDLQCRDLSEYSGLYLRVRGDGHRYRLRLRCDHGFDGVAYQAGFATQAIQCVDDKTWKVHFDDWMFLQPNGVLINRAKMSKFGIELGEVILFFQRGG